MGIFGESGTNGTYRTDGTYDWQERALLRTRGAITDDAHTSCAWAANAGSYRTD
jgi:hypothetical protein